MSSQTSSPFQDFPGNFHSRKLFLFKHVNQQPVAAPPSYPGTNSFDSNVVMVLSVLLCALICSLGLNILIRCIIKCSSFVSCANSASNPNSSSQIPNKGIKQKALKTFPVVNYSAEVNLPALDTECVICLSEFAPGERVRLLPKCNHGFHVRCIDKWLKSHSSCPKCRHCLIETSQKIVGSCSQQQQAISSGSSSLQALQEIVVNIAPLEPEGMIRNN